MPDRLAILQPQLEKIYTAKTEITKYHEGFVADFEKITEVLQSAQEQHDSSPLGYEVSNFKSVTDKHEIYLKWVEFHISSCTEAVQELTTMKNTFTQYVVAFFRKIYAMSERGVTVSSTTLRLLTGNVSDLKHFSTLQFFHCFPEAYQQYLDELRTRSHFKDELVGNSRKIFTDLQNQIQGELERRLKFKQSSSFSHLPLELKAVLQDLPAFDVRLPLIDPNLPVLDDTQPQLREQEKEQDQRQQQEQEHQQQRQRLGELETKFEEVSRQRDALAAKAAALAAKIVETDAASRSAETAEKLRLAETEAASKSAELARATAEAERKALTAKLAEAMESASRSAKKAENAEQARAATEAELAALTRKLAEVEVAKAEVVQAASRNADMARAVAEETALTLSRKLAEAGSAKEEVASEAEKARTAAEAERDALTRKLAESEKAKEEVDLKRTKEAERASATLEAGRKQYEELQVECERLRQQCAQLSGSADAERARLSQSEVVKASELSSLRGEIERKDRERLEQQQEAQRLRENLTRHVEQTTALVRGFEAEVLRLRGAASAASEAALQRTAREKDQLTAQLSQLAQVVAEEKSRVRDGREKLSALCTRMRKVMDDFPVVAERRTVAFHRRVPGKDIFVVPTGHSGPSFCLDEMCVAQVLSQQAAKGPPAVILGDVRMVTTERGAQAERYGFPPTAEVHVVEIDSPLAF
eukprot:TRINITY_DN4619_c0_g1_i1.p1 TRINITY_DN4619_c0_g1~~TRINITY_DN4619_c0_g1_i1.p1  ORF type:complete len:707 (-),score=215.84 TRINITY_DN4619_c0_g1_i1:1267-3387(-)